MSVDPNLVTAAQEELDLHVRETVQWHFSPETGCPFWLDWARQAGWDPREQVKSFADLIAKFPHFQDEWLRDQQSEVWVPAAFRGRRAAIQRARGPRRKPGTRLRRQPQLDRLSQPGIGGSSRDLHDDPVRRSGP